MDKGAMRRDSPYMAVMVMVMFGRSTVIGS